MKFEDLLRVVGEEPVFESPLLLSGPVDPNDVRRQLSRWVAAGRVVQLRRGLYALAPPFSKVKPHPFVVANRLVPASYVSAQSALAHRGMIPEFVPVTISVTTSRPARRETPLGTFEHRHVKPALFWGFEYVEVAESQRAHVAAAEKAILDLVHLTDGADRPEYLRELRLQNLDRLDLARLDAFARRALSPKLSRAAEVVAELAFEEAGAARP